MKKITLLSFVALTLFSVNSFAISFNDSVYPELASSGRALAMGNAFICKVDDSHAAFYNPAGLGTVRMGHFHLVNAYTEMNKGLLDTAAGGRFTDAASGFMDGFDLDGNRKLLLENRGKITHSKFQTMPNILFRYFTAGFFITKQKLTTLGQKSTDNFEYASRTDYGPYVAMNLSLFGGIFKFGGTLVGLSRHEIIDESASTTTVDIQDEEYNKGTQAYVIGGARLTLPTAWLPTFAATLHNATAAKWSGRAAGAPENIYQTVDVGFSVTPQIGKVVRLHLEGNYKDIGQAHKDISTTRRLVMGAEIDFARTFFIRFGYGDGFGSAGIGMKARALEFDFTSYAVDTTQSGFRGNEDRRFVFSLSSGF